MNSNQIISASGKAYPDYRDKLEIVNPKMFRMSITEALKRADGNHLFTPTESELEGSHLIGIQNKDGSCIMPGGGKVSKLNFDFGSAHRNSIAARENGVTGPILPSLLRYAGENCDARTLCCLGTDLLKTYMDLGYFPIGTSVPPQELEIRNPFVEFASFFLMRNSGLPTDQMDIRDIHDKLMVFNDPLNEAVPVLNYLAKNVGLREARKALINGELKNQQAQLLNKALER